MKSAGATWLVIIAASLWGTTGTVAHAIGGALSPLVIGAATMGFGGAILWIIAGSRAAAVWEDRGARAWALWGALGVAVYPLAFYTGMDLAGVAVGNILALGTGPLVGAVLEWVVDKKAPQKAWWFAISVGVLGVLMLSFADHAQTTADPRLFAVGVIVALIAGVAYGLFSYAMGRLIEGGHSPMATAGGVFGAGSLPLLVIVGVFSPQIIHAGSALWGVGYLVALPMVLAYVLYTRALRHLLSSTVLTVALLEPAVATLLAVLIVGERFDMVGAVGLVLIVVAVALASRSRAVRNTDYST